MRKNLKINTPSKHIETDETKDEDQSEEEQPHNDNQQDNVIQSEQVQPQVQHDMELPVHDGLMHHSPIKTLHIRYADMEEHEEPMAEIRSENFTKHGGKRTQLRRSQDISHTETPKITGRNINKNKNKKDVSPEYIMCEKETYLNIT